MRKLQDIAEIEPKAQELLGAAGYFDVNSLQGLSLNEITEEVVKANHALELMDIDPTAGLVKQWLEPLKNDMRELKNQAKTINEDEIVTSKELLAASFAIPLSRVFVESNDINISQLLDGRVRFLSDDVSMKEVDYIDEVDVETLTQVAKENQEEIALEDNIEEPLDELDGILPEPIRKKIAKDIDIDTLFDSVAESSDDSTVHIHKRDARINKDRILTMEAFRSEGSRIEPLVNKGSGDLTRATRKETNKGVDPSSKRYIRGVLHKRAGSFMFSLFAYLSFIFCIIAGFTLPLLALMDKENYAWSMFSPLLVIVGVMIYFMFTGRASCPICNQKQFAPKNCLKHRDAHRLPLFGYMLPTALHALFYKWFKCIFCGTSVRLKE